MIAPPVLSAEVLVAGYSAEVDILKGVPIRLKAQEIVSVVGPNGAGKSTLMKAIFGLVQPKSGRAMISGRPISGLRPSQVARLGVGYVPQRANVFPSLTVAENLEIASRRRRISPCRAGSKQRMAFSLAADYAVAARIGRGAPTVDMRVEHHRAAMPGPLIARGGGQAWRQADDRGGARF